MSTIHYTTCPLCKGSSIQSVMSVKDHSISQEIFEVYNCASCSFVFTQQVPDQEHIGRYYEGDAYISHSDSRAGLVNKLYHKARSIMLERKQKLIKSYVVGKRHLDYGAGTGYFLEHMKRKGYQVKGIEIDSDARAFAKSNFEIDVDPPSSLMQDQRNDLYDSISMWHVLEHIQEPHALLQKLHQVLSDDGYLFVAVPNHTSTDGQHYGPYWAGYDVPRHLWHFSPKTMRDMARRNGFEVIALEGMPFDPYYNSLLSERYMDRSLALLRGAVSGLKNTIASWSATEKASSIIYILQKTKPLVS